MRKSVTAVLASIILACGNTVLARDHHDGTGGAGGMAHEHMGQRGSENTNAQWGEGATKGQERSGSRHQDGEGNGGGGHANHGKDKHKDHDNGGKHKGHHGKDHAGH
ncbi:hypothetical protein SAMN05216299_1259 [Nitrosospira sp. Nsp14]|uniref:hypothetical protein n=1 Tax=Nitrosospira sp. Nsp14 TaxID=1855333 RepID=UPI0008E5DFD1|nr:hypothetical protein [Nitrosospira sp. Nsp14]SFH57695.1 hypothetical protein SAMN05216299_1259 [Nitrosospira sp. Nsp14]